MILFGGCPYSLGKIRRNETWSFNRSAGWVELNNGTQRGPSARQGPMVAYDPPRQAVILFGGDRLGAQMGDTWEWKHGTWTDISANAGGPPPARYDGEMAWDPAVKAIVLFGGSYCVLSGCKDTWEFGTKWTQVWTKTAPPGRNYYGLVYDPAAGRLVLSSGQAFLNGSWAALSGTWEFNGTAWVKLHPLHSPPPEQQAVMAFDKSRGYILFYPTGTGATWIYCGGDWINITASLSISPAPRALPAMVMDPGDGVVLMMGGAIHVRPGGQAGGTSPTLNDTWVWT